jgi:hypothetical protein
MKVEHITSIRRVPAPSGCIAFNYRRLVSARDPQSPLRCLRLRPARVQNLAARVQNLTRDSFATDLSQVWTLVVLRRWHP